MTETVEKPEVEEIDEFELNLDHLVMDKTALAMPDLAALVAEAGSGKTHSALDLTKVDGMWPLLVLDTEGSTVGVSQNFDPERFDVIKITNHKQLSQMIKVLTTKSHKYKTVVIDTIDTAQERALEHFDSENPGDGFAKWKDVAAWLTGDKGLMHTLRRADFFSVVVVHSREEKSDSGAVIQKVKLQGSSKDVFASIPDLVLYQTRRLAKNEQGKSEVSTTVYTVGTKTFSQAKNRFGLEPIMKDSTLKDVFEAIRNK